MAVLEQMSLKTKVTDTGIELILQIGQKKKFMKISGILPYCYWNTFSEQQLHITALNLEKKYF